MMSPAKVMSLSLAFGAWVSVPVIYAIGGFVPVATWIWLGTVSSIVVVVFVHSAIRRK